MSNEEKLGQEPAFMQSQAFNPRTKELESGQMYDERMGMSKRFYAATHILSGFAACPDCENIEKLSKLAYIWADELLKLE